ncbi:MAG: hypothetical protein Q8P99_02265 [bacterium]|nr:hypothetical protein [bacterium]
MLIEEMAYAHAVRGKSSAEDKRPPVTTMAKAPETERNSWYIVCRILHDCLPAVAIALMERGDAVQTEVATV